MKKGVEQGAIFSAKALDDYSKAIKKMSDFGIKIGIVVGGGNIFRGRDSKEIGLDRQTADNIGMLGTFLNALALRCKLNDLGLKVAMFSPQQMPNMTENTNMSEVYTRSAVLKRVEENDVLIFAGGLGQAYFSTDTVASIRAVDMKADILLKATGVDGVYDRDPKLGNATRYNDISFDEFISKGLAVMDMSVAVICKENGMKCLVFNGSIADNLWRVMEEENIGTLIK